MQSFRRKLDPVGPLWFLYKGHFVFPEIDFSTLSDISELKPSEESFRCLHNSEIRKYLNTNHVYTPVRFKIRWYRAMKKDRQKKFGV